MSKLSFCVIAQGAKEVYFVEARYAYDADGYLLAMAELPVTGRIVSATDKLPYLSTRMEIEPALVGSIVVEAGIASTTGHRDAKALAVSRLDAGLRDASVRLVRLLGSPSEARVLLPMVRREIVYRLLVGEQGARLRHLPAHGENVNRIGQAIERLRQEYDQPLSVEGLARELGMSPSGFHHHFKAVTDMSSLQFQKRMRLQEARRLMLGENLDASRLGYDDASHFSKDYKRLFGESPVRNVERLCAMTVGD